MSEAAVPQTQGEVMLTYVHNTPCITYETRSQVADWTGMQKDLEECLVCYEFQPANPNLRASLECKGITFKWSDLQKERVGPMPRRKNFLTVLINSMTWSK